MNPFIIKLKTKWSYSLSESSLFLVWHLRLINLRTVNDTSRKCVQSGLSSVFDLIINRYNLVTARMGYWNSGSAKLCSLRWLFNIFCKNSPSWYNFCQYFNSWQNLLLGNCLVRWIATTAIKNYRTPFNGLQLY